MSRGWKEVFSDRYRWPIALSGVVLGVLATVLLYQWTAPRPTSFGSGDDTPVPEAATIRVGALPVT